MDEKNKSALSNFKKSDKPEVQEEKFKSAEELKEEEKVREKKEDNLEGVKESGVLSPDLREKGEPVATDMEGVDSAQLKENLHIPSNSKLGTSDNPDKSESLDSKRKSEARKVFNDSVIELDEARKGRTENNIPLGDAYWDVLNRHRAAYRNLQDA